MQPPRFGRIFFDQREVHLGDEVAAAIESGIESACFERAAEEQAGAEKQHERESDLRHDGDVARRKKRLKRPVQAGSPTCCFRSLTKSARVAFNAGPRLKSNVASRQNRNVTARTRRQDARSTTKEKFIEPRSAPSNEGADYCTKRSRADPRRRRRWQAAILRKAIAGRSASAMPRARDALRFPWRAPCRERATCWRDSRLAMSRTAPAIAINKVPMSVTGPSSSGVVLRLKRDGFWICSSRAPSESGG